MTKIFLHLCCAPCAVYPLARLGKEGFSVTGYFYNPNIHPYQEYAKRLAAVRDLAALTGMPVLVKDGYDLDEFLARVAGRGAGRCEQCYRMRLESAADTARTEGFSVLSTTLLYSRRQKHDLIRGVAREAAEGRGMVFHDEDFRTGWKEGIEASKSMGLYRQQYCGCIFSERERYEIRSGR